MAQALYPLVLLACPLGMGLMMWLMMRGKHDEPKDAASSDAPASQAEVAALREEIRLLRAGQDERSPEMFKS
jgi:hypothetical protein